MKWIEDHEGMLINLDQIVKISVGVEVASGAYWYTVEAMHATGPIEFFVTKDKKLAKNVVRALSMKWPKQACDPGWARNWVIERAKALTDRQTLRMM